MNVVLISTYDLGHQPFGLASVAAWLRRRGADVMMQDLAVQELDETAIRSARLIAIYMPMHTATRLALPVLANCRSLNNRAHISCFGLYAPMNGDHLRDQGADLIIGGEFETTLLETYVKLSGNNLDANLAPMAANSIDLRKQQFLQPDRHGLPALDNYAKLVMPDRTQRAVGYTEASRGCKHLCRHCPIVPVYQGRFRTVQRDVVLADIRQQVSVGAKHISFGDPDFFNGVGHAIPIVTEMHAAFPDLSYDVTIKVEHLLSHAAHLKRLAETGCLFVTTAVEAVDDRILGLLRKQHTRADFISAVELMRAVHIDLSPTFVPFTPWTTLDGYIDLLETIDRLDLVASVAPIQLAIRLLLPAGSLLMELEETKQHVTNFDSNRLAYQWRNPDPAMDHLQGEVQRIVQLGEFKEKERGAMFQDIWDLAHSSSGKRPQRSKNNRTNGPVPHMTEEWYCCAEPSEHQFERI